MAHSRTLPSSVLQIIHDFSKPVTRPDWKTFERTINPNLFIEETLDAAILTGAPLFFNLRKNMRCSTFYLMYIHIEYRGVDSYIQYFGGCKETILSNRWLAIKQKDYELLCFN